MSEGKPRLQISYDSCRLAQEVIKVRAHPDACRRPGLRLPPAQPFRSSCPAFAEASFCIVLAKLGVGKVRLKHFGKGFSALFQVDSTSFVLIWRSWQRLRNSNGQQA